MIVSFHDSKRLVEGQSEITEYEIHGTTLLAECVAYKADVNWVVYDCATPSKQELIASARQAVTLLMEEQDLDPHDVMEYAKFVHDLCEDTGSEES